MKKAVFFDIDGTLMDTLNGTHHITDRVRDSIYELQKQGNIVFIASGRPYAFLSEEVKKFGFDGFILANGAHIMLEGKTIFTAPMDKEHVNFIIKEFEKHGIQYVLETDHYTYRKEEFKEFKEWMLSLKTNQKLIRSEFEAEELNILKIEVLCAKKESIEACQDILQSHPAYGYYCSITDHVFELYQKEYTKASAILRLLDYLDIEVEDSFAFGDGTNDIEMLSAVGCGIAMGNASDHVKSFADKITLPVDRDGVAAGIEEFIVA